MCDSVQHRSKYSHVSGCIIRHREQFMLGHSPSQKSHHLQMMASKYPTILQYFYDQLLASILGAGLSGVQMWMSRRERGRGH
jgi:hypothetical protein